MFAIVLLGFSGYNVLVQSVCNFIVPNVLEKVWMENVVQPMSTNNFLIKFFVDLTITKMYPNFPVKYPFINSNSYVPNMSNWINFKLDFILLLII